MREALTTLGVFAVEAAAITAAYVVLEKNGIGLREWYAPAIGGAGAVTAASMFFLRNHKERGEA